MIHKKNHEETTAVHHTRTRSADNIATAWVCYVLLAASWAQEHRRARYFFRVQYLAASSERKIRFCSKHGSVLSKKFDFTRALSTYRCALLIICVSIEWKAPAPSTAFVDWLELSFGWHMKRSNFFASVRSIYICCLVCTCKSNRRWMTREHVARETRRPATL